MTIPRHAPVPSLREALRPGDPERIRDLVRGTGFFSEEEQQTAAELAAESLARGDAAGYHYLFADDGEGLAGYACFGAIPFTREAYDLYWIAVAPAGQGRGLGRRLVTATEQRVAALGGTRIYVDTSGRAQYAPTRAFYEACGYEVAARLEHFYAAGDAKVLYLKVLA